MGSEPKVVIAEQISASAFEPFGWLPLADTDPADGSHRLEFAWADPHVNVISHSADEVGRKGGALVCDKMFRHQTHTQALLVLDNDSVLAVAPAEVDFSRDEDVAEVRVFRLVSHDSLVLHRGTWHWGPFPLGDDPVHLYNVQGLGYEKDNECVDLERFAILVDGGARDR
ncbi:MAG: ureidoglycolate lyase [Acidimicrobiales bacterium]